MDGDPWFDENPFYLVIETYGNGNTVIDLGKPGWMKEHADLMRVPSAWVLHSKQGLRPVAVIMVAEGEQPYYTKHHVGYASGGAGEVSAYGIGKKRLDGHTDRIWILPNGIIAAGDDVDTVAMSLLRMGGS